ncbi:Transposable element Tc1 transposase, partial [Stegodyphus mimosarum]
MPRRRKRARFEQLTEFERGRIIGLREAGLSYRAVASRVQRNSSTVMRVWKQWTDECRTTRKSGSGPRNVTSARDDRHLVRMARTDRTASSRQLAALWSIATGVSLCASSIRRRLLQCGLRARTPLYRIPLTHDHRRLRLQWANQHRDWRADWQHVVFSDESRFNLWYHDGRIRVRRYAGERHLPECIIERHSGRTPGVMVWGAIAYHRRSQLLRIVGNLNSNRYIREVLQPEAVPFLQSLPGAVFQQDNARPHTARIVKSFFAAQQVQLLPWPACSPDMSPIEHVWDVIGRRLARDPRPVASADELWWLIGTLKFVNCITTPGTLQEATTLTASDRQSITFRNLASIRHSVFTPLNMDKFLRRKDSSSRTDDEDPPTSVTKNLKKVVKRKTARIWNENGYEEITDFWQEQDFTLPNKTPPQPNADLQAPGYSLTVEQFPGQVSYETLVVRALELVDSESLLPLWQDGPPPHFPRFQHVPLSRKCGSS